MFKVSIEIWDIDWNIYNFDQNARDCHWNIGDFDRHVRDLRQKLEISTVIFDFATKIF